MAGIWLKTLQKIMEGIRRLGYFAAHCWIVSHICSILLQEWQNSFIAFLIWHWCLVRTRCKLTMTLQNKLHSRLQWLKIQQFVFHHWSKMFSRLITKTPQTTAWPGFLSISIYVYMNFTAYAGSPEWCSRIAFIILLCTRTRACLYFACVCVRRTV